MGKGDGGRNGRVQAKDKNYKINCIRALKRVELT